MLPELAAYLGYQDYAEYVLETKMARNRRSVEEFSEKIRKQLEPLALKELQDLLDLKKIEMGDKFDGVINEWDFSYYINRYEEKFFGINEDEVR